MGTAQVAFAGVLPEVTWLEVTLVTCHVRKYVLRMHNRKLCNILLSRAFSPEVTWPEETLTESMFCASPDFSRVFFLTRIVVQFCSEVTSDWRHRKRPCPEVCPGFCFEPIRRGLYPLACSSPTERNSWSELGDVHVASYWSVKKIQNTNGDFLYRYIVGTRT